MAGAIRLAQEGFCLSPGDIELLHRHTKQFASQPTVAAIFLKNGKPYQVGDRLVQKDLAQTLKAIADSGASSFYQGKIAASIVQASQENGGILSLEDFASYRVIPFVSWGAAESLRIEPKTGLFSGVNDPRRADGKAVGY